MPNEQNPSIHLTLPGVYVPHSIILQLDEALAALYGLLNSAIEFINEDVAEGTEKHIVCVGSISHFFNLYDLMVAAGLLSDIVFDREDSTRRHLQRVANRTGAGGSDAQ